MASNRPGGSGLLDIWVARRDSTDAPFGAPENVGPPINSRGGRLLSDACSGQRALLRQPPHDRGELRPRRHLLRPAQPRTRLERARPSRLRARGAQQRARRAGPRVHRSRRDGATLLLDAAPRPFPATSSSASGPTAATSAPPRPSSSSTAPATTSSRTCARTGARSSSRPTAPGSLGQDIWSSTRASTDEPWSAPVNLGAAVNTAAAESRPSLSWDGQTLLFGRAPGPEGMSDIYTSTRSKLKGASTG